MIARRVSLTGSATDWLRVTRAVCGYALAGMLVVGPLGGVAIAHAGEAPAQPAATTAGAAKITRADRRALDHYMNRHPHVARQLRKDPALVNSPEFLAKHSSLQKLLTAHPELQAALKQNPGALVKHTTHPHKTAAAPQAKPATGKESKGS